MGQTVNLLSTTSVVRIHLPPPVPAEFETRRVFVLPDSAMGATIMDVMIIFPEFAALRDEVRKLRTVLSILVLERDELRYVECPNIETAYLMKLGALEYQAFEAKCAYLRLKRKVELLQAKRNRQEKPDLKAIETQLDAEFADFREKLNEQIEKMNEAIRRNGLEVLSGDDTRELKRLYRRVVRALHPDLHPDISPEQLTLFHRAVEAYQNGDLATMRVIDAMASEPILPESEDDAMTALIREHDRLKGLLDSVRQSIQDIKADYPYTLKAILLDEAKVQARKTELETLLAQLRELCAYYQERIRELLGENHG